jgi:hypothetical protein
VAISKYPDTTLPTGAVGTVLEGFSSIGGVTWTSSTPGAGNYRAEVNSYGNDLYFISAKDNKKASLNLSNSSPAFINLTTTETKLKVNVYNSWATGAIAETGGIGIWHRNYIVNNNVAYFGVQLSTGTSTNPGGDAGGAIVATTNGVTWTTVYTWASGRPNLGIVNNGNGVYFVGSNSAIANFVKLSTDLVNWNNAGSNGNAMISGQWIVGGGGLLMYRHLTSAVYLSTDGSTFNSVNAGRVLPSGGCVYSPEAGMFVVGGITNSANYTSIAITTNGTSWNTATIPGPSTTTGGAERVTYGGGLFAMVVQQSNLTQAIAISSNGTTWTLAKTFATTDNGPDDISYADGLWITNHSGNLNATVDFINWVTNINGAMTGPSNVRVQDEVSSFNGRLLYSIAGSKGAAVSNDQAYISVYTMGGTQFN